MNIKDIENKISYNKNDGCFYWLEDNNKNKVKKGQRAGWSTSKTYVYIQVDNVIYPAHRLAYMMHYQKTTLGGKHIDHIDGNKKNNRIENLRLVSPKLNNRNKPMTSRNKSGFMGISWHKLCKKWRVQLNTDKGKKHGGYFNNIEDAIKVRNKLYEENGYTKQHGRCCAI